MPKLDFGIQGASEELAGFDNKPIKPGTYKGILKSLKVTYIKKEGPNKNKPRLNIGCQVESGPDPKGKGRMVWGGLNVIEGQEGWVNQFLNAVTDGSSASKKELRRAFWNEDGKGGPDSDEDGHILKIGRFRINSPNGEIPINFTVKTGKDQDGNPRSEIGRFLEKKGPSTDEEDEATDAAADADDDDDDAYVAASSEDDDEPPF